MGVDYVTLAFINESPEKAGSSGYPGLNLGAHCAATTYQVGGESTDLLSDCSLIAADIPVCQALGTKILLSIGGVFGTGSDYTVSTVAKGEEFATFMWGAFGPYETSWTGPRPFDISSTDHTVVDGFDFDIEIKFGEQPGSICFGT
jgi:chitinase